MEARLSAIQRGLVLVVVGSVLVALVALPRLENRKISMSLAELSALIAGSSLAEVTSLRQRELEALKALPLHVVQAAYEGRNLPRLRGFEALEPGASPQAAVAPLTSLQVTDLESLLAQAKPGAVGAVALPDAEDLARALAFRLARSPSRIDNREGVFVLQGITLQRSASLSAEDAAREQEAARLRLNTLEEKDKLDKAERKLVLAEGRVEARKKRRSKSLAKFQEALEEARTQRDLRAQSYADVAARYEALAQHAERVSAEAVTEAAAQPGQTSLSASALPGVALAEVTLQLRVEGRRGTREPSRDGRAEPQRAEELRLRIPVRLVHEQLTLPPLAGVPASLPTLQAAGFWEDIRSLDPARAHAFVTQQYNWHRKGLSVLGVTLPGTLILQAVPWLLPLLLFWLGRRVREAATSHRLFAGTVPTHIRRAGFKSTKLEWLCLVALPVLASLLAAAAMLVVGAFPALPALATAAVIPLGMQAHSRLEELRALNVSIVQYHSYPPPAMASLTDPAAG